VLTAVILGACSVPISRPIGGKPTPVPWTATTRMCQAADLGAVAGEAAAASGGQRGIRFVFANHSSTACTLHGIPGIQLLDGRGTVIPTTATVSSDSQPVIILAPGHVPPSSLPAAYQDPLANHPRPGEAEMLLGFHQSEGCANPVAPAAMIQVRLPGNDGTLLVKIPSNVDVVPCPGQLQLYPFTTGPV
jgi:hypothetical protein